MESVYPTVDIELLTDKQVPLDDNYKILGLTINPLFMVQREQKLGCIGTATGLSHFLPPKNKFQVWIELVLGHNSNCELDFPRIKFSFNESILISKETHSKSDRIYQDETQNRGFSFCNGKNFEIYKHFWLDKGDLLKNAYGSDANRIVPADYINTEPIAAKITGLDTKPGDARFALAFQRSSYRLTPNEIKNEDETGSRLSYPCTFQIIQESETATARNLILQPRPFELDTWSPSYRNQVLKKSESISFWFYYSYPEQMADAPDHDMFSFINNVTLNDGDLVSSIDTNCFPRFPHRFDVKNSEPPLIVSPFLSKDPQPWQCSSFAMYPMTVKEIKKKEGWTVDNGKRTLAFFFGLKDEKTPMERNVGVVIFSLALGILLNFISTIVLGNNPETTDMALLWLFGVTGGVFFYVILAVLKGRVDGAWHLVRYWERNVHSSRKTDRGVFIVTLSSWSYIILCLWYPTNTVGHANTAGHVAMVVLAISLLAFGWAICGLLYDSKSLVTTLSSSGRRQIGEL